MLSTMSSFNNYRLVPVKRKHDEVAPEFPSLPYQSFTSTQTFAEKSQEALSSIGSFSAIAAVFLPLISSQS